MYEERYSVSACLKEEEEEEEEEEYEKYGQIYNPNNSSLNYATLIKIGIRSLLDGANKMTCEPRNLDGKFAMGECRKYPL